MNEDQLRVQLEEVYSSTSWKVTAPLRLFSKYIRLLTRTIFNKNRNTLIVKSITNNANVKEEATHLYKTLDGSHVIDRPKLGVSPLANQLLKEFEWRQLKK